MGPIHSPKKKEHHHTKIKRFKFTLKPLSKKQLETQILRSKPVDEHWDLIQEVDKILRDHEDKVEEIIVEPVTKKHNKSVLRTLCVEPRETLSRKLETSEFTPLHEPETIATHHTPQEFSIDLSAADTPEFRFITSFEPPRATQPITHIAILPETNENLLDRVLGNTDVSIQKTTMGLLNIKRRTKEDIAAIKEQHTTQADASEDTTTMVPQESDENQELATARKNVHDAEEAMHKTQQALDDMEKNGKKILRKKNGLDKLRKEFEHTQQEVNLRKQELAALEQKLKADEHETKEKEKELKRKEHERKKKEKVEKQVLELEQKESYIPVDLNHRVQIIKEQEEVQLERQQIEHQKLEKQEEHHKKQELKVAEKEAKKQEKLLRKEEKRKQKELKKTQKLEQKQQHVLEKQRLKEEKHNNKEKTHAEPIKKPTPDQHHPEPQIPLSQTTQPAEQEPPADLLQVIQIADALLAKLPEDVIDAFVQTDDFALYEKVLSKYKIR